MGRTSDIQGLSPDEVAAQRRLYGTNELPPPEIESFWDKLLENFQVSFPSISPTPLSEGFWLTIMIIVVDVGATNKSLDGGTGSNDAARFLGLCVVDRVDWYWRRSR